jgi:Holliday junction resolvase-like predicted endonuclease
MATIFTEGELTFTFGPTWQAYRYDEPSRANFHHQWKHQGIKAVDFIAQNGNTLLLMEVKHIKANDQDSRMRLTPNADTDLLNQAKDKLSAANLFSPEEHRRLELVSTRPYLVDEVAKKTKDTLIGLLASHRNNDQPLSAYNQPLNLSQKRIVLMLFLERSDVLNQAQHFKPLASHLQKAIEQKTHFLGNISVTVNNSLTLHPQFDITATPTP